MASSFSILFTASLPYLFAYSCIASFVAAKEAFLTAITSPSFICSINLDSLFVIFSLRSADFIFNAETLASIFSFKIFIKFSSCDAVAWLILSCAPS